METDLLKICERFVCEIYACAWRRGWIVISHTPAGKSIRTHSCQETAPLYPQ